MERDHLLNVSGNKADYQAALARVRDAYDSHFGRGGMARNVISLFLFAGPIASIETCCNKAWQSLTGVFMWDRVFGVTSAKNGRFTESARTSDNTVSVECRVRYMVRIDF